MKDTRETVYRILDASANRVTEGMRTIEEYVRFGLDDENLTHTAKELRHRLASTLSRLSRNARLAHRDTESDVGTRCETQAEYRRTSIIEVLRAAIERVQQSLRVLEEYGKTMDIRFAKEIEQIRYQAYTFHRDVELSLVATDRQSRLADATLYVLVSCEASNEVFASTLAELASAEVDVIQLRDKTASDRLLLERARIGIQIAGETGMLFLVNDRADIAAAAGADGVHVGQTEMPVDKARQVVGEDRLVGVSTHDPQQVHAAIEDGADYIGCGPTFPSGTKSFDQFPGIDFLRAVDRETKQTPKPVFAIGGINIDNVDQVLDSGFRRIAVSGSVMMAENPGDAARALKKRLDAKPQN